MAEPQASMPEAALSPTAHPLAPCSGEELERAASILIASGLGEIHSFDATVLWQHHGRQS